MIRTEAATEIHPRFYSFHLGFFSCYINLHSAGGGTPPPPPAGGRAREGAASASAAAPDSRNTALPFARLRGMPATHPQAHATGAGLVQVPVPAS
eukprot:COSAG01_NODE_2770_length_7102_cov_5.735399_3_plen_95_part_00